MVNHKKQSWRRRMDPTMRRVEDTKKKSGRRHRRRKKPFFLTNFGNWVKFEAPLPKEKVKIKTEKTRDGAGVPQVVCAGCASAARRATEMVSALTQGWHGEKSKLQAEVRLLQGQVASLQQQLSMAKTGVGDAAQAEPATATQGALSRTQKKVRAVAKQKQVEKSVEPVDLTRVVPDCVLEQMKLKPDFRQTVLTSYKPGDESEFPGAAYLHPKEAALEKAKHQNAQQQMVHEVKSDATAQEKTEMTAAERSEYEKIKKRAERFGVPLSVCWGSRR